MHVRSIPVCLSLLLFACSTAVEQADEHAPPSPDAAPSLSTSPEPEEQVAATTGALFLDVGGPVRLLPGKTTKFRASVRGHHARVVVRIESGSAAVAAASVVLQPSQREVELELRATADANVGDVPLAVVAESEGRAVRARATLTVGGAAGTLDESFGVAGSVALQGPETLVDLVAQPDGKLVVAREVGVIGDGVLVQRILPSGQLDGTFGGTGAFRYAPGYLSVQRLVVRPDGRLLVVLYRLAIEEPSARLIQLTADGQLDSGFGTAGQADVTGCMPRAATIAPDGAVLIAGHTGYPRYRGCVQRLSASGALDASFASGGTFVAPVNETGYTAAVVRADGKVVLAGSAGTERLGIAGAPDPSFAKLGDESFGLALAPDGDLLVSGGSVRRLRPDGSSNATFGVGGSSSQRSPVLDLLATTDGIYAELSEGACGITRLSQQGHRDAAFGVQGVIELEPALDRQPLSHVAGMAATRGRLAVAHHHHAPSTLPGVGPEPIRERVVLFWR